MEVTFYSLGPRHKDAINMKPGTALIAMQVNKEFISYESIDLFERLSIHEMEEPFLLF